MLQKKINSLQGLRCFAALVVCIMHVVGSKPASYHSIMMAQYALNSIGKYGVDLFFTISGFIIAWIVMKEKVLPSIRTAIAFLIKRLLRIYSLYWITLGFMIVVAITMNGGVITPEVQKALHISVFFLFVFTVPMQVVAWTLPFELYFYSVAFFFMCLFPKKYFFPFFAFWALAHFLTIQAITHGMLFRYCFILMHNRILEFFFGLLIGYLLYAFPNRYRWDKYLSLLIGTVLLLTGVWIAYARVPNVDLLRWEVIYYYACPSALFIYGFVGLEMQDRLSTPKVFKKLGDASYSLYLWHVPVMQVMGYISIYWLFYQHLHPLVQVVLEVVIAITVSFASYRWIEQPFIRLSHRLVNRI